jgi:hypothetical protein
MLEMFQCVHGSEEPFGSQTMRLTEQFQERPSLMLMGGQHRGMWAGIGQFESDGPFEPTRECSTAIYTGLPIDQIIRTYSTKV